jgi:hypothetical protein
VSRPDSIQRVSLDSEFLAGGPLHNATAVYRAFSSA